MEKDDYHQRFVNHEQQNQTESQLLISQNKLRKTDQIPNVGKELNGSKAFNEISDLSPKKTRDFFPTGKADKTIFSSSIKTSPISIKASSTSGLDDFPLMIRQQFPEPFGLYDFSNEHDACGVGMIARLDNQADHSIIERGLTILKRLMHRGAAGNDPMTGDGAGILLALPDAFFRRVLPISLPESGKYGVAMIFNGVHEEAKIESVITTEGGRILFWRDVPIHPELIGKTARQSCPVIRQLFIGGEEFKDQNAFERKLFVMRRRIEKETNDVYLPSCSSRSVVYKGLLLATQIDAFYSDLSEKDFVSPLAVVHQRYSTNTFPTWQLAHPFRLLAHNGEINTLRGNLNQYKSREASLSSSLFGDDLKKLFPLFDEKNSDSASLDNMLELLVAAGRSLPHAILMLMPQAWGKKYHLGRDVRGFFDYHSAQMEPWDGPAAVAFSDGVNLGAILDRNGLRPARYSITQDGLFVLASEAGVLDFSQEKIIKKGRLKPGEIIWVDLEHHRIVYDAEIKNTIARQQPYRRWADENKIVINGLFDSIMPSKIHKNLKERQRCFGWSREDIELIIQPMSQEGKEPIGSMGNDAALPILSNQPQSLFKYFKQLFAQVTNPPIDPIREELVMSLTTYIGNNGNILNDSAQRDSIIKLERPILTDEDVRRLSAVHEKISTCVLKMARKVQKQSSETVHDFEINENCHSLKNNQFVDNKFVDDQSVNNQSQQTIFITESYSLSESLERLQQEAVDAVQNGSRILILSDQDLAEDEVAIPSLLATSAVHRILVEKGLRPSIGLLVQSGEIREIMHYALLLGYGATAIHPYLTFETIASLVEQKLIQLDAARATENYIKAVDKGLLKVMSKMGISTLRSYRATQLFEAVGLDKSVIDRFFPGTASRIGGLTLDDLDQETKKFNNADRFQNILNNKNDHFNVARENCENSIESKSAVVGTPLTELSDSPNSTDSKRLNIIRTSLRNPNDSVSSEISSNISQKDPFQTLLPSGGEYRFRRDGENHLWTPQSLALFREAVQNNDYEKYRQYAKLINEQEGRFCTLRGLFRFAETQSISINEVEGIDSIVRRFVSGAMSLGSISPEAHEAIAIAMNRLGGKSNCGEGGEDPNREKAGPNGENRRSAIRQVASGRFGVTTDYLANAQEIQIKMAQGAKPGEGGQLPGHKVDENIARVRHSIPYVTLISPPPHHDIYSIEDLAQLIFDLHNANEEARVSVKLVSEVGVGTIAAGVAKAHADVILISGHDGGTGASPLTSIKYAGLPWELGLAETQQTLVLNNLRNRVRLQVDGQLKTGRDVMIAALLGAEEFGFATTLLVSLGCLMMRKCHENSCPVGIATQDPILRKCFKGKPEYIEHFLRMLAEEVREYLAQLGFQTLDQAIGRSDLLEMNDALHFYKSRNLDFSKVFECPIGSEVRFSGQREPVQTFDREYLFPLIDFESLKKKNQLLLSNENLVKQKLGKQESDNQKSIKQESDNLKIVNQKSDNNSFHCSQTNSDQLSLSIKSVHRTAGTALSSEIVRRFGAAGLPNDSIIVHFNGVAGQSFGAFLAQGITFILEGEANDFVGKGISGGKIIIKPLKESCFKPEENVIAGNVIGYGGTAGKIFLNGLAGERFAIRNSGFTAVVEGVGDHGCEYMTGGRVVVLGSTGVNFAAGMTGGIAYVYDASNDFDLRCNVDTVDLETVLSESEDEKELLALMNEHIMATGSPLAQQLIRDWSNARSRFVKVIPFEYKAIMNK